MIIGRKKEIDKLKNAYEDDKSHLIAVYGRRRVGKTFLINETFKNKFTFKITGMARGNRNQQLLNFYNSMLSIGYKGNIPENWITAFFEFSRILEKNKDKRKVLFFDELSWMDTPKSDFLMALENFWNNWACSRHDVILIVCGSATSWILSKIIHNKGGLYNRLTDTIRLKPFNLYECEQFFNKNNIVASKYDILEYYMILGGIPYYFDKIQKGMSLAQNIDAMFFSEDALLGEEFDHLFSSIFKNPKDYIQIIKTLATKKSGLTRIELSESSGIENSGAFSKKLEELEKCGFIRIYRQFGNRNKESLIQLIDNFTLFYLRFLNNTHTERNYWSKHIESPERRAWCGLAFERVCFQHINQIIKKLGVSGVSSDYCSWHCNSKEGEYSEGSQIDLLIDRNDRVINLCEIKYSKEEYEINKEYERKLRTKLSNFADVTKTKSSLHLTLISPYGLKQNIYSNIIQQVITAPDLFVDND